MVLSYTEDELNIIFNNPDFLLNYDTYKTNNNKKINDLQIFLDSFKTNKNYHKISINKNKKYQSIETTKIKNINNLLNKCTSDNIVNIKKEILDDIKNTIHIAGLVIDSILSKCILQPHYMSLYIDILKCILEIKEYDVNKKIVELKKNIYVEKETKDDYNALCELNENIDSSISLSILIVKLESCKIITNHIDDTISRLFDSIVLDNEDICYKYIISLYNIFEELDNSYISKYNTKLNDLKNSKISKKNKFKIMDILEMV